LDEHKILVGPFTQILCLADQALKGPLKDDQADIIQDGAILIQGDRILEIGAFENLYKKHKNGPLELYEQQQTAIALPAYVDAHTHICFAGSRARDYAMRNAGISYLEIAKAGGGIWDTVTHTRKASEERLTAGILQRMHVLKSQGIATVEIKSGYGLNVEEELKMLRAIETASLEGPITAVPTCLAAHIKPRDFDGSHADYLDYISDILFPVIKQEKLTKRIDIFVEEGAFSPEIARVYLQKAMDQGFELTIHADQFSVGGSRLAVELSALSADHLEASGKEEIQLLAASDTVAMALPGASMGLGCDFTPARKLLDAGACLAIASDWNPGSAPMGDLVTQASVMATFEKLTNLEVLAGISFRAAFALRKNDIGRLKPGFRADFNIYDVDDYNEILYHQGTLKPCQTWLGGKMSETI
jgi:imidazolonepropionase